MICYRARVENIIQINLDNILAILMKQNQKQQKK